MIPEKYLIELGLIREGGTQRATPTPISTATETVENPVPQTKADNRDRDRPAITLRPRPKDEFQEFRTKINWVRTLRGGRREQYVSRADFARLLARDHGYPKYKTGRGDIEGEALWASLRLP